MSLFLVLIYLAMIAATGYAAMSALLGNERRHWAEVAGLSFAAGLGIWAFILFLLSLAGFVPSPLVLGGICVLSMMGLGVVSWFGAWIRPVGPTLRGSSFSARGVLGVLAVVVIGLAAANVAVEVLTPGLADMDAFAIWMLKAKIVASQALLPVPPFLRDPSLSFSHQDYPLLFPLIVSGAYAAAGGMNIMMGKLFLLPTYLALILVIYGALRRRLARADALIVTAIYAASPVLRQHAGQPIAESTLLLMHACTLVLLLEWMEKPDWKKIAAVAAFAAFTAFSKNEGLALLPIIWIAAFLFGLIRRRRQIFFEVLVGAAVSVILIGPWLIYRNALPKTHEDYGGKFSSAETVLRDLSRTGQVLPGYLGRLREFNTAGGIWILLALAAVVGWRAFGQGRVLVMWFILLAHLALYALTFMVTPWPLDVLIPMVTAKLLMHIAPCAALLIGLHLARFAAHDRTELSAKLAA